MSTGGWPEISAFSYERDVGVNLKYSPFGSDQVYYFSIHSVSPGVGYLHFYSDAEYKNPCPVPDAFTLDIGCGDGEPLGEPIVPHNGGFYIVWQFEYRLRHNGDRVLDLCTQSQHEIRAWGDVMEVKSGDGGEESPVVSPVRSPVMSPEPSEEASDD